MPPKANNNRPTRRGTRSSTHAGDLSRRATEEAESRNRDTAGSALDPSSSGAMEHDDFDDDLENLERRNGPEPVRGPLGLVRPPLDPSRPPHLSGNRNNYPGQTADRNSSSTTFIDQGNTTYNGLRPPSEPPSSLRSKYGIPTGRASSEPYSPGRPDTSRSFIQESDLYGEASVHTPAPITGTRGTFRPSPLGQTSEVADDKDRSTSQIKKQPPTQTGQPKSPSHLKPTTAGNKKRPESLTGLEQEKTRKPIVGPHTPHIPHLGENLSPPPSLGFSVENPIGGVSKGNEGQYKEPEDVTDLRNRMRYQKHPQVLGPSGVPMLTTQNITQEEQKEVSELRRRLQNPNLVSATLGRASRPPTYDPLPTTQKPKSPTTVSQPTGTSPTEKITSETVKDPEKPVSTHKEVNTQNPVVPVEKETDTHGKKPRVPSTSTGTDHGKPKETHTHGKKPRVPSTSTGTPGTPPPNPSSRSWWQLPQMLWPIPLDVLKDFLKMFLMFGGTVLAIMFCIQLVSKASDIQSQDNFWPSVKDIIPTIRHPLQSMENLDAQGLVDRLNRVESRLGQLGKTIADFPSKCYLKVDKKGKTHVPEDFWHALKDRIQAESGTVVNIRDDDGELPKHFWDSFKRILDAEKTTELGTSPCNMDEVEAMMEKKLLNGWESWLRQNSETVSKILGPNMAKELPAKTQKELKDHVENLVNSGGGNLVVTSQEFVKQVQKELETHKEEFQKELADITERNEKISQALTDAQNNPLHGMSRLEIKTLVNQWAVKAFSDAKFEAMAQTGIKSHLDDHLANQVNFFGHGSGAVIDPTYTSHMWKIPPKPLKSKAWLQRDGYKPQPALVALQHWTDEGQCFCTGKDRNTLSVLLSRDITPQHLVVEHILPGATLDPEAMPKEIEVWAYFEELNLRSTISSWSAAQFPDTPEERTLNQGFVKIGHFVYRKQNTGDKHGMQLFKLSSELAGMDAVTHHVVIRAVSNYGADHTCFYRLRMFGDVIQEDMGKEKIHA